jgi:hypothetical protein
MVGMVLRDFVCSLCGNTFEKYAGDLNIPGPELCEQCMFQVWEMEGVTLITHIHVCLNKQDNSVTEHHMLQYVNWLKTTWKHPEDAIKTRKILQHL